MRRLRTWMLPVGTALAVGAGCVIGSGIGARTARAAGHGEFWTEGSSAPAATPPGPSFADLAERLKPAVVNISTTTTVTNSMPQMGGFGMFFGMPGGGTEPMKQHALGSGFIVSPDGYVVTNNHVVDGADDIQVKLLDGRVYPAKVVGTDPDLDVALLRLKGAKDLPTVPLGDSNDLRVGDWVVAIGNPFGLGHTVTAGIISAKDRTIGDGPYDDFLQTDAPINPGNSGGPLFNLKGEVIGINTAISAQGQGIGFAIPIDSAKRSLSQLYAGGKVVRGWLGVGVEDVARPQDAPPGTPDPGGAKIAKVYAGSPAAKAGLEDGDVVTLVNGKPIASADDLTRMVGEEAPHDVARLTYTRAGKTMTASVTLGDRDKGQQMAKAEEKKEMEKQQEREQQQWQHQYGGQWPSSPWGGWAPWQMGPWGMMGPWGGMQQGPQGPRGPQGNDGQGNEEYQSGPGWQMWQYGNR